MRRQPAAVRAADERVAGLVDEGGRLARSRSPRRRPPRPGTPKDFVWFGGRHGDGAAQPGRQRMGGVGDRDRGRETRCRSRRRPRARSSACRRAGTAWPSTPAGARHAAWSRRACRVDGRGDEDERGRRSRRRRVTSVVVDHRDREPGVRETVAHRDLTGDQGARVGHDHRARCRGTSCRP